MNSRSYRGCEVKLKVEIPNAHWLKHLTARTEADDDSYFAALKTTGCHANYRCVWAGKGTRNKCAQDNAMNALLCLIAAKKSEHPARAIGSQYLSYPSSQSTHNWSRPALIPWCEQQHTARPVAPSRLCALISLNVASLSSSRPLLAVLLPNSDNLWVPLGVWKYKWDPS